MNQIHPIIKLVVVTILATFLTYIIGITNYLTAGIIAMISIQKTKSLSLKIAGKRSIIVAISMAISSALFLLLGYNLFAYSMFIVIIVILSYVLHLQEGTIPSVVVVTHLFILGVFSIQFIFETTMLYVISVGIALLFNLFYPSESMKSLEKYRTNLDTNIKDYLIYIRDKITAQEQTCKLTHELEKEIDTNLERINQITGDLIMKNHQEILEYASMRSKQFEILKNICAQSDKLQSSYPQTLIVIQYLDSLSNNIGVQNYAKAKLQEIDELLNAFKKEPLPLDRNEFEHRAILYYITLEIRQFLILKIHYHNNY